MSMNDTRATSFPGKCDNTKKERRGKKGSERKRGGRAKATLLCLWCIKWNVNIPSASAESFPPIESKNESIDTWPRFKMELEQFPLPVTHFHPFARREFLRDKHNVPTCISIDPSFLAFPAFLLFPSFFSLKRKGETRDLRPVFQRALTRVSRIKAARNIHTPLLQSFSSYFLPYLKHFALVETYIKCKNSSLHFHCASTRLLFNSRGSRRLTFSLIGQPAFYSSSC